MKLPRLMSRDYEVVLHGGQTLYNVHSVKRCQGSPCPIHNPSGHHMNKWHQTWDKNTGLVYRICPHGNYHIDPDNFGHSDCSDDYHWTKGDDYCCIDPRDLTIVNLSDIVSCMPTPSKGR